MAEEPSAAVQAFLMERIEGYEQLVVLLPLHRHASRVWTEEDIAAELRIPLASIGASLKHLGQQRLLKEFPEVGPSYRYSPEDVQLEACVQQLAQAWDQDRLAIIGIMNRHALDRMRNSALRAFSNAFRLKGHENG
jgi:hypothetical protein